MYWMFRGEQCFQRTRRRYRALILLMLLRQSTEHSFHRIDSLYGTKLTPHLHRGRRFAVVTSMRGLPCVRRQVPGGELMILKVSSHLGHPGPRGVAFDGNQLMTDLLCGVTAAAGAHPPHNKLRDCISLKHHFIVAGHSWFIYIQENLKGRGDCRQQSRWAKMFSDVYLFMLFSQSLPVSPPPFASRPLRLRPSQLSSHDFSLRAALLMFWWPGPGSLALLSALTQALLSPTTSQTSTSHNIELTILLFLTSCVHQSLLCVCPPLLSVGQHFPLPQTTVM